MKNSLDAGLVSGGTVAKSSLHELLLRQLARCTDDGGRLDLSALLVLVDRVYRRNEARHKEADDLLRRLSLEITVVENERRSLELKLSALALMGVPASTSLLRLADRRGNAPESKQQTMRATGMGKAGDRATSQPR